MKKFDIVLLTDPRYLDPTDDQQYVKNVILEDRLVEESLQELGFITARKSWDDKQFNWNDAKYLLFRTTWDYFERYPEFSTWLKEVSARNNLINPARTINWNIDKHYLEDLRNSGINIPETIILEPGEKRSLEEIISSHSWPELILKPCISGGAWHTYRFKREAAGDYEDIMSSLLVNQSMMLQEFQYNILSDGEAALMVYAGKYSHSILKKAKPGDFRVQDDFGGSVHPYNPSTEEIEFAEKCVAACDPVPVYARVDLFRDNSGNICLTELELIEPEMWFRVYPKSAKRMAEAIRTHFEEGGM